MYLKDGMITRRAETWTQEEDKELDPEVFLHDYRLPGLVMNWELGLEIYREMEIGDNHA